MKIHRFFVTKLPVATESFEIDDTALVRHMKSILALAPKELFELCDGKGTLVRASIMEYTKNAVSCMIQEIIHAPETLRPVTAYIAILKRDNFELIVQKLTEIGITTIVPVITSHTIKTALNIRRLQTISKEAAELAGRTQLPKIAEPIDFKTALKSIPPQTYFFDGRSGSAGIAHAQAFFIGPEGGWTEAEITMAHDAGCISSSLGPLTLRGETAAIIAGYLSLQ